jgi:hypothetical protein
MDKKEELRLFKDKVEQVRKHKLANYQEKRNIADTLLMEDLEVESRVPLTYAHELLERIDLLLGILEGIGELIVKFKEQEMKRNERVLIVLNSI